MCWIVLPTWDTSDRALVQWRYGDRDPKRSQLLVSLIMRIIKISSRWLSGCWLMILIKNEMEKLWVPPFRQATTSNLGASFDDIAQKMRRILLSRTYGDVTYDGGETNWYLCGSQDVCICGTFYIVLFSLIELTNIHVLKRVWWGCYLAGFFLKHEDLSLCG